MAVPLLNSPPRQNVSHYSCHLQSWLTNGPTSVANIRSHVKEKELGNSFFKSSYLWLATLIWWKHTQQKIVHKLEINIDKISKTECEKWLRKLNLQEMCLKTSNQRNAELFLILWKVVNCSECWKLASSRGNLTCLMSSWQTNKQTTWKGLRKYFWSAGKLPTVDSWLVVEVTWSVKLTFRRSC